MTTTPPSTSAGDLHGDVTAVMDDVSRRIESHGGSLLWDLDSAGVVTVELRGACQGCPALPVTYVGAIRTRLLEQTAVAGVHLKGPLMSRFAVDRIARMFGAAIPADDGV